MSPGISGLSHSWQRPSAGPECAKLPKAQRACQIKSVLPRRRLSCSVTAVNVQHCAGDVGCFWTGEEYDSSRDFFWLAVTALRNGREECRFVSGGFCAQVS